MARPRSSAGGGRSREAEDAARAVHESFMRLALAEARTALHLGEVPVGAVLVSDGRVVAEGFNQPIHTVDPTAHAEVVALRRAAKALGNYRLTGTTLYVTLEPCLMCVGALVSARVSKLVYGALEPKGGAVHSIAELQELRLNHHVETLGGVLEADCRKLIVDFFKFRREEG
jgi:tRNA(adenine34) deaminase